jgi:hypothetical protein
MYISIHMDILGNGADLAAVAQVPFGCAQDRLSLTLRMTGLVRGKNL